jgi:hypothetical protein
MMSTFYNYIIVSCLDGNKVFNLKFKTWEGSQGGPGGLDVGEVWYVESDYLNNINDCYLIVERYLNEYDYDGEIIGEYQADDFIFTLCEDCEECVDLYNTVTIDLFTGDDPTDPIGPTQQPLPSPSPIYPPLTPEPTPTPTNPTTTPIPETDFESDADPCFTYEITNNGNVSGDITISPCDEENTIYVSVDAGGTVYFCLKEPPQYNNYGYGSFGFSKTNFVWGTQDTYPPVTLYNNLIGEEIDGIEYDINSGHFMVNDSEIESITINIYGSGYSSTMANCGNINVQLYIEDEPSFIDIGIIESNFGETTDFDITHTIESIVYGKKHWIFLTACNHLTYSEFNYVIQGTDETVSITHENNGSCGINNNCGDFNITYLPDGGCAESTTYSILVSDISNNGGPYRFTLNSGGSQVSYGDDIVFSGISSGNVYVLYEDISGSCDSVNTLVQLPTVPNPTITAEVIQPANCFDCDGVERITFDGFGLNKTVTVYSGFTGNPNILYNTYNNVTDPYIDIPNLCGGVTYKFVVESEGGCYKQVIRTMTSNLSVMPMYYYEVTDSDCGTQDSIRMSIQNSGVYVTYKIESDENTFQETTGSDTHIFYDIPSGDYGMTITTLEGCEVNLGTQTIINEDRYLVRVTNKTDSGCSGNEGGFNLSITENTSQVQLPIDIIITSDITGDIVYYNIDSYSSNFEVTDLPHGNYQIKVTDVNGCIQIDNTTIEPGGTLDFAVFGNNCVDGVNGFAEVQIISYDGNYTIEWFDGSNGEVIENLTEGTYDVTISDDNCTLTKSFTIVCDNGNVIQGSNTSTVCEGDFELKDNENNVFNILTINSLKQQFPVVNDDCSYIPTYHINFTITSITDHEDIVVNDVIYVGDDIQDTITESTWVESVNTMLNNISETYDFIGQSYVNEENEMIIMGVNDNNQLINSQISLSIDISIDEVC